jgi:hypothetical protein
MPKPLDLMPPVDLMLPDDWKQRTRVFVTRKTPVQTMTPMVPKAAYDADRDQDLCLESGRPSATAMRKFVLQH